MPGPCGGDDVFKLCVFGFPTEFSERFLGSGHEPGRIAGPAGFLDGRDAFAGNLFAHLNHFADGIAFAITEIEEALLAGFHGEDVGLREIDDVDIIANAGAVRRGIVGAVNFALRRLAQRDFEDVRDEMGFDPVMLAVFAAGTGGVKIAERDEFKAKDLLIPEQHLLEHELGFAVGINRALGEIFCHGHAIRRTIRGAGGTENEFADFVLDGGFEQFETRGDVVAKIFAGVLHRFANECMSGEVNNGFGLGFFNGAISRGGIAEIPLDELCARIDRGPMSLAEVIQHRDHMPRIDQLLDANGSNITCSPRNQYIHSRASLE